MSTDGLLVHVVDIKVMVGNWLNADSPEKSKLPARRIGVLPSLNIEPYLLSKGFDKQSTAKW